MVHVVSREGQMSQISEIHCLRQQNKKCVQEGLLYQRRDT